MSVAVALRWVARVWSLLSVLFVLVFAFGELTARQWPTPIEWIGLSLWPIGVCAGLIVGWFRDEAGGILALGCLAAFYFWSLLHSGHLPRGPFFALVAAPGFLFVVAGLIRNRVQSVGSSR